jgi:hypothetical protein
MRTRASATSATTRLVEPGACVRTAAVARSPASVQRPRNRSQIACQLSM